MADDRRFRGGDFYRLDDISGFKVRASHTRKQWNNLIVAKERWEARQPQDFVRGQKDDQSVPDPRPRQVNQFTVVATYVTGFAAARTSYVVVESTDRMVIGDLLWIVQNNGEGAYYRLMGIDGLTLRIVPPLQAPVGGSGFGDPIENQVFDLGSGQGPPVYLANADDVPLSNLGVLLTDA